MVDVVQLVAAVGPALVAANGAARAPIEITGVHISELPDPTPYLEGGEMLLTTGMPLGGSAAAARGYIDRLSERGVRALVLGLGPIHQSTPEPLAEACALAGFPLLVVPVQHAFRTVTNGYWELVAKEGRAGLVQQIGTQTSVVREAAGPRGAARVTKLVAQSLGTWAGAFLFDGSEHTIWPEASAGVIPALRRELQRFAQRGDVGAATFPLHGYDVIAYPIGGSGRAVGAFVVGTTKRLSKTDRQLILTAAAALSLRASLRADERTTARSVDIALAALLADDEVTAARALAGAAGGPMLPASVRVFAAPQHPGTLTRGDSAGAPSPGAPAGDPATADTIVAELVARGLVPPPSRTLSTVRDGCLIVLMEPGSGTADLDTPPVHQEVTGAMSDPVPVGSVRAAVAMTVRTARRAAAGTILTAGDDGAPSRGEEAARILRAYTRAPLVESVRGYIRHRGSWESVARDLGVHRNTVRSRVRIARDTLGVDLDDPDLVAELWIALREQPPN